RFLQLPGELDRLSMAYVARAFAELHWTPGASAESLGIVESQRRLFARLSSVFAMEAANETECDGLDALRTKYPECDGDLALLDRCGSNLAKVLCGEADPLTVLFPGGSLDSLERLYQDSPFAGIWNRLIQDAVATAIAQVPEDRRIRVLE